MQRDRLSSTGRSSNTRNGAALLLAATVASGVSLARAADYVFANPLGGDLNVSANYLPSGVPGGGDTLRILTRPDNPAGLTLYVAANQSVGRIEYGYFGQTILDARAPFGTPYTLTLASGQLDFTDAITQTPGGRPLTALFVRAPIAGGAGLGKTGPGFASLSGNNTYTNGTTITGPGGSGVGGLTVGADVNLGASSGGVTLANNGTLRATTSFTSARAIALGGGGRIESYGTLVLNGNITGNAPLTVGGFTGGSVTLGGLAAMPVLNVDNGATANLLGRLTASGGGIRLGGTLNVGLGSVGPSADAISDGTPINSLGGRVNLVPAATDTLETVGPLTLTSGTTTLDLAPTPSAGAQLAFASVSRANRSTLFVRGRDLGNGPLAANRALVTFGNTAGLPLFGGTGTTTPDTPIVSFLFGNATVTGGDTPANVVEAGFVTRTANGLRVLDAGNYRPSIAGATQTENVRLTDGAFTQNANVIVNSLLVRDTSASGGNTGVGGTGTITVNSGAIAAVSDVAGEPLYVNNPISFGAAEGIVHTAPTSDGYAQLTLRGAIAGVNGLTKAGVGDLYLENVTSSYTGTTTIDAGLVNYSGSVIGGQNSALGAAAGDVVINAGVSGNQYVGLRAATPGSTFNRGILVRQSASANSLALLGTVGGYGTTFGGTITVEGGFLNLLADLQPQVMTISGNIVGAGGLQDLALATPTPQYVRLTGAGSTYSGGTVIRAGRWEVGSDVALGTGTVYFEGNGVDDSASQTGAIAAFGIGRLLGNPLVFRAAPVFSGANALGFYGPVDLGSVQRDVVVTNTADTTFSGVVSRGGLTKRGDGRLILGGPNTYTGQTVVAAGILRATNNDALGNATGQAGIGQATFITGTGVLELAGGITTPETVFFGGAVGTTPAPVTLAAPAGNLRNVSGTNTLGGAVAFDNVGSVGVDAGSSLTLAGDTLDNTSAANATLRKVGAGTLNVRNVRLPNLAVDAGTLRVTPAGAPTGTSRVGTLGVAAGARLDLTNNTLVLDYAGASPQVAIIGALSDGRIITSIGTPGAAVGYAEASGLFPGATFPQSYAGQSFDATALILTQTRLGDANLDRIVDFADLLSVAQNYGGATGKVWLTGDFTYDGAVDFNDLLALAQNYGGSALVDLSGRLSLAGAAGAGFGSDWALAQSLVPEPATLTLLALVLSPARRRR